MGAGYCRYRRVARRDWLFADWRQGLLLYTPDHTRMLKRLRPLKLVLEVVRSFNNHQFCGSSATYQHSSFYDSVLFVLQ